MRLSGFRLFILWRYALILSKILMQMAITIITPISKYMFSSELQTLQYITQSATSNVSITLSDNKVILSCEYFPDASGLVTILDIHRLLAPYIEDSFGFFNFIIEDNPPVVVGVVKSSIAVGEVATDFLSKHFLTTISGTKETAPTRHEILSIFPTEDCDLLATCSYYKNGIISTFDQKIVTISASDSVVPVLVSSDRFVDFSKGELISYTITAGSRKQTFAVNKYANEDSLAVIFRNCFDAWETIYLSGTQSHEPEYIRSNAYVNANLRNYEIEENAIFKISSGVLQRNIVPLALDLARSKSIFLLNADGTQGDEIIVTDSEIKYNNDDNSLPSFVFTCRPTNRVSARLETAKIVNLFDEKFDDTYE